MTEPRRRLLDPSVVIRGLVMIATLALVGFLLESLDLKSMLGTGWVDDQVKGKGLTGELLYLLVCMVGISLGLPRQVVSFLGGYAFGFWIGSALALAASLAGSAITFTYARLMGRDALARRFPGKVRRIDAFLAGNPLTMALVVRLSPFSANLVANLAAGVSGVPWVPFFIGSGLGFLPQTVIFALLGSGFQLDPVVNTVISAALFIISTILGIWLWRRYGTTQSPEGSGNRI